MRDPRYAPSFVAPRLTVPLAVALTLVLAACGSERVRGPEAQPGPGVTSIVEGQFDKLPHYPRSNPVNERTEEDGVTVQTFQVENANAEQILDFYARSLPGWDQVEAPHQVGVGTYRGVWQRGDRRLTVSAGRAPTLAEGDAVVSQYSLRLGPA